MATIRRQNHYPLLHLPLLGSWLFCTILFVGFQWSGHAQAAAPALLQTLPPRFVNEQGQPLANTTLRLLCYTANGSVFTHTQDLRDATTGQGQLAHQLPTDCPYIVTMQESYQQPSGKPGRDAAYTVYNTSWLAGNALPTSANGTVVIHSDQHLVLFNVAVALEWEPAANSPYLRELEEGLRQASNYLYDITDGQMAFGSWQITTGGYGWDSADIRIRAANDYRPSAQVGGIVAGTTAYTSTNSSNTLYRPGAIVMGRYWDGTAAFDSSKGAWNQPAAYRTLVHEWLHYALFLYDEYQAIDADGRTESYCSCADLPQVGQNPAACSQVGADLAASVMGYHYTASELWLGGTEASCLRSEQFYVHGGSDWETLARWGTIQGLPTNWLRQPTTVNAGPTLDNLQALDGQPPVAAIDQRLFLPWLVNRAAVNTGQGITTAHSAAVQDTTQLTVNLSVNTSLVLTDLLALQVQIYTWEPATATQPARVIYQGTTTGERQTPNQLGTATLVGIKPGTRLAVYVIHPGATNYAYYGTLDSTLDQQDIQAQVIPTSLSLAVTPRFDGVRITNYHLQLQSSASLRVAPVAQICAPDAALRCAQNGGWQQGMIDSGSGITWTATLSATSGQPFPELGILQISTSNGDLFRWYDTLGGVGPGRIRSHAPRRDGLVTVDGAAGFSAVPNLVFMMPTANNAALQAALPPGVSSTMGSPYEIKVLLPDTNGNQVVASSQMTDTTTPATPVLISMFADKATVERLNLQPNQSQMMQYQTRTGQWQLVTPSGRSDALSWVASRPLSETGILAVARMSSPDFALKPEIYAMAGKPPNPSPLRVQIIMPAASTVLTMSAFVRSAIPLEIKQVGQIQCNFGHCFHDPATQQILWQGEMSAGDLLFFSFELFLDGTIPPGHLPKTLTLTATAFDGAQEHPLTIKVPLRGPHAAETSPPPNGESVLPPRPTSVITASAD